MEIRVGAEDCRWGRRRSFLRQTGLSVCFGWYFANLENDSPLESVEQTATAAANVPEIKAIRYRNSQLPRPPGAITVLLSVGSTGYIASDTRALNQPERQAATYAYYADNTLKFQIHIGIWIHPERSTSASVVEIRFLACDKCKLEKGKDEKK